MVNILVTLRFSFCKRWELFYRDFCIIYYGWQWRYTYLQFNGSFAVWSDKIFCSGLEQASRNAEHVFDVNIHTSGRWRRKRSVSVDLGQN